MGKEILPLSSSAMVGFKLAPGKVPENYQLFDLSDSAFIQPSTSNYSANGLTRQEASNGPPYNEFLRNFNDTEEEKSRHRKKFKRSLDNFEGGLIFFLI